MYLSHNVEVRSCNHCCSRKSINIAYSEFEFVALVSQNAMCMCHTVLCGLALKTFSTLSNKRYDFRKKLLNIKRMF
jgi:hypothetical protein